jgi:hypothetical protein
MPLEIPADDVGDTPLSTMMLTMATVEDMHDRVRSSREQVRAMEKHMAREHKKYRRGLIELQEMQSLLCQLEFDLRVVYPPPPTAHPLATTLKELSGPTDHPEPSLPETPQTDPRLELDTQEPDADSDAWWK